MVVHHISHIAIIVAAIFSVLWGWAWHTWCCGKKWAHECGMHSNMDKKHFRFATLMSFIGALLTAYVLARFLTVAQAANLMPDRSAYKYGLCLAFSAWIGFYVPMTLHATVWLKKSWQFFLAKIFNQFIHLVIIAMLLAYWTTLNRV